MNSPKDAVFTNEKVKKTYPFPDSERVSIYHHKAMGLIGSLILMASILFGTAFAGKIPDETNQKLKSLKIPFIMNHGQADQQVKFYAKTFSGTVYVTDQGKVVYELPAKDRKDRRWVLVEEALDSLSGKEIRGEGKSDTKVSFFIGNNPAEWKRGLPTYEGVDLGEVYNGIKLKLRAYGGSVEKLYYVSPEKDPKEIRIKVKGAESLKVNDKGELEVQTGNGPVIFSRPKAFQKEGGKQKEVEVNYLVNGDSYGFKVAKYDVTKELIIDPLIQSTYLGGSGYDNAEYIAVSGGNVYVAGWTYSSNFPGTGGGAQPINGGGSYDAFVSLLTADLKQLVQSTYLGGNGDDNANYIGISGGNVYVAGGTYSSNFPGTGGGAQQTQGGGASDAFVSLLSADLKQLVQSTYLGGGSSDFATSMAISGGNIYVAGFTYSNNFPGTIGGAQPINGGGSYDAFVSLLTADLKQLVQSTYLGRSGKDQAQSIIVFFGNIYVTGSTGSTDFPGTSGGAQPVFGGGYADVFVSMLSTDLKQIVQSTYLGGTDGDYAYSLATSGGQIYVAGHTESNNFPGTSGGAQPVYGGSTDAFVSLLSADLKQLVQSTYLGGTKGDFALSIKISASTSGGNVHVAGHTASTNFPGTTGGAQPTYSGGMYDVYVSLLNIGLTQLIQSTYLGGTGADSDNAMAISSVGNVYVAGHTASTNFPGTTGGAQAANGGGEDAFVALLSADLKAVRSTNSKGSPWMLLLLGN